MDATTESSSQVSPDDPISNDTDDSDDTLLSLSFNQDGGCLAAGTASGFRICNVFPFQETFRRTFASDPKKASSVSKDASKKEESSDLDSSNERGGGIGIVEMLFRCNLLALVGGGVYPHYNPNKVIIWDDHYGRPIGDRTFRQEVLTVKLRRDRICVAICDKVYVYNFSNFELLDTIVTGGEKNGAGLLAISTDAGNSNANFTSGRDVDGMVLACPSIKRGQVRVELYGHRKTNLIDAHEGSLAAITLTVDGSLLATASVKGTLVRLFDTGVKSIINESTSHSSLFSGTPLREFRRGVEQANIGCLCFSLDKFWLGCASDRGTVHVFRINEEKKSNSEKSKSTHIATKLAQSFLPSVLNISPKKYLLEGEHSYAQVRGIPRPLTCAFVPHQPNTIAVAGMDDYGNGCLLLAQFGRDNGEGQDHQQDKGRYGSRDACKEIEGQVRRVAYHRFFKKGTTKIPKVHSKKIRGEHDCGKGNLICSEEETNGRDDLDDAMNEIVFEDNEAEGFVSVGTEKQVVTQSDSTNDIPERGKEDTESSSCPTDNCSNEDLLD